MAQLFTNNASSELAVSIGQTTTSITLRSNTGARFPAVVQGSGDYFYLTIYDQVGGAESNYEIVKVTNRSNDIITVQRGQDGTAPMAYIAGAKVELRLTSEAVNTVDASEVKSKTDVIALQNVIAGNNLQGAHLLVSGDSHLGEATFDGTITANQLINATMGLSASQITTAALSTLHSLKVQTTAEFDGAAIFDSAFSLTGDQVQISEGGTGATTAAQARTNLDVFSKSEADERYINTTDAAMVTLTNSLAVTGVNGISTTMLNVTGAVILSSVFAALTTVFAAVCRPVELRGADPERRLAWAAAGFVCTAARTGGHYVSMLLVMTFNVWIIIGVLLGHAVGYLALAGVARRGSLPADVRAVGEEESGLEQQPGLGAPPRRETTLLQEATGSCCAQNCECA